ncbi:MAG: hypothetical protein ACRDGW_02360, partial [Actinomycetota bacterium]
MEPIEYLGAIRRRWLVVAAATVAITSGAWATTAFASPAAEAASYQTTAVLLRTGGSLSVNTMTALIGLRPVAVKVAELIGFEGDPLELRSHIGANFDGDTGILFITATDESPEEARLLANAYAKSLISYIQEDFAGVGANRLGRRIVALQEEIAELDALLLAGASGELATELQEQRFESSVILELLTESYRGALSARLGGSGLNVIQPAPLGAPIASDDVQILPASGPARIALGAVIGLAVGIAL